MGKVIKIAKHNVYARCVMAMVTSELLPGIHQKILEIIVKVQQCDKCNSSGELEIEEPTLEDF